MPPVPKPPTLTGRRLADVTTGAGGPAHPSGSIPGDFWRTVVLSGAGGDSNGWFFHTPGGRIIHVPDALVTNKSTGTSLISFTGNLVDPATGKVYTLVLGVWTEVL